MALKRIVVTGNQGYIGSVLTPLLQQNGYETLGWDTGFYLSTVLNLDPTVLQFNQDIRSIPISSLADVDAIIHLAALSNDPTGELDQRLTEEINYKATIKLAHMAKESGVKRFIFASSCSVYGIAKDDIVDEKSPVNPLTAYARSKINSENDLLALADESFCVGVLRNATVYGFSPNFRDDLVVNNLASCALATNQIKILSDGTPWRPLIDVRDLASIMITFLAIEPNKINHEIFNVGFNNSNFQVKDLALAVQRHLPSCSLVFTGEHGNDSRSYQVNFDKFSKVFAHLKQQWPLDVSIADMLKQLKAQHYTKEMFLQKKYARLTTLKQLLEQGKLDKQLYWTY